MSLITVEEIRKLLEGYCISEAIVSNEFISNRRDCFVIPIIINSRLGISINGLETKEVYINGTGKDIIILPDKNIIELINVTYVNTETVYTPTLSNFIIIKEEGVVKAKFNFNESFVNPTFPKGTRNIKFTYTTGFNDANIPKDLNELIGYLTIIQIFNFVEGRSGGGDLQTEGFSKNYGNNGKYTNIRRELVTKSNYIIRKYRGYTV